MSNKKLVYFLLPLLLGFLIAQAVSAGSGEPGSNDNPVISKSYADKVFEPLKVQLAALQEEVTKLKGANSGNPVFSDVSDKHWAYNDIKLMVEKGIITGLGSGKFGPDLPARRCEVAVMLIRAIKMPTTGANADFKDVSRQHWAYNEIAAAQKAGIISGFPGGEFKPNDYVTRGQMAVMLVRAFALKNIGQAQDFKDVAKGYWAYEAVLTLAGNGISKGFEDNTFRPANLIKRAEVAVFLAKTTDLR